MDYKINGHIQFVTKYIPYIGGGEIQFIKTAEGLRKLGVDIETVPVSQRGLPVLVHFFGSNGALFNDFARNLRYNYKIPYIVSTIFFSSPSKNTEKIYVNYARLLIKYGLEKCIPRKGFRELPFFLRNASLLLPNTRAEANVIKQFFPFINEDKIRIVPNGVDEQFANADGNLFRKHYNIDYDFVLNVARLESRKNQLSLIKALKGTGLKLIFIGNQSVYPEYTKACFNEADDNVLFINELSHNDPLLASAYAASKVFALPSNEETPGISALEAALAGSTVAVTRVGGAQEYFIGFAKYINPNSIKDIRDNILSAWESNIDKKLQKKHIISNFSWPKVAECTLKAYREVLGI